MISKPEDFTALQNSHFRFYFSGLLVALIFFTAIRYYLISTTLWPISGDEAQYWIWAKNLAWGYYSKPPLIAWLIAFSTHFFGDSSLGLRFFSPLLQSGTALICFFIGCKLFSAKEGFWASLIYLLSPGCLFASQMISTDTPLLFFWALALWLFLIASETNQLKVWCAFGLSLGLAFLSKFAALFFLLSLICLMVWHKPNRKIVYQPGWYLALLICGLLIVPNIIWNAHHSFVSFYAVKDNADLQGFHFHYMDMLNFILSQFIIFNPMLFFILMRQGRVLIQRQTSFTEKFLLSFIWPLFIIMVIESLLSRAHANWVVPIYVSASIYIAGYLVTQRKENIIKLSLIFNLVVMILFFYIKPIIQLTGLHLAPSMTQIDWQPLKQFIKNQPAKEKSIYLADDRLLFANIVYFGKVPLQKLYKWNPQHLLKDQFDLTRSLDKGNQNYYVIFSVHSDINNFQSYFKSCQMVATLKIPTFDQRYYEIKVFEAQGFKGY